MNEASTAQTGLTIGVLGAGAVGWYVGGALMAAGADVVVVGRHALDVAIERSGLVLGDLRGRKRTVPQARVAYRRSIEALGGCDVVLCCVKSGQTAEAARQLARVVARGTIVVSLQNGLRNAEVLRAAVPGSTVLGGIVGFNVVHGDAGVIRRTTSGPLVIERSADRRVQTLAKWLRRASFEVKLTADIRALQWSKLLLNLNNAVGALSDVPTAQLLFSDGYRQVIGAIVAEALDVMRKARVHPGNLTGLPVRWFPAVLRLPTPLLRALARTQLAIDPQARSSMWEDLSKNRLTEVDHLNGEIVRLARSCGVDAPVNQRIVDLVHAEERRAAGSPRMSADALWSALHSP